MTKAELQRLSTTQDLGDICLLLEDMGYYITSKGCLMDFAKLQNR